MITEKHALELVANELKKRSSADNPLVVIDAKTVEKPYGWVFFYNSKKFVDTGIFRHRLAGNGPVIVNSNTGSIDFFGTNKTVEEVIKDYELKISQPNDTSKS